MKRITKEDKCKCKACGRGYLAGFYVFLMKKLKKYGLIDEDEPLLCCDCYSKNKSEGECELCGECASINTLYYYPDPESSSQERLDLCESCYEEYQMLDIEYCNYCERYISTSNGMSKNFRFLRKERSFICIDCLKKDMIKNGQQDWELSCWWRESRLRENGYAVYQTFFVKSKKSKKRQVKIFNKLKNKGLKPIISLVSSGMGLEYTYKIFIKERDD